MKNTTWLSAYVYYQNDADTLLRETVSPLVQKILSEGLADHYFFIRYWDEKGDHIRLRFQHDQAILEKQLKPLLKRSFTSIQFVDYDPEIRRYGGKSGVQIAEKLFQASSNAVLSYLHEQPEATYTQKMGFALQLDLSMVHALGMDRQEASDFFNHMAGNETTAFEKSLKPQKEAILPQLRSLWEMMELHSEVTPGWFAQWIDECRIIAKELQKAYTSGQLQHIDPQNKHKLPLWYLYESYVHMNNNRLGILNNDEPYLTYILKKGLTT